MDTDEIKSYLKWTIIDGSASSLSMDIDKANWEFYGKVLNGSVSQRPLEKRAVQVVNSSLGDALGKVYVSDKFTQEAKDIMIELILNTYSDAQVTIAALLVVKFAAVV